MAIPPDSGAGDACVLRRARSCSMGLVRGSSAASRYERFFVGLRELPPSLLARVVEPPHGGDVSLLALTAYECSGENR